MVLTPSAMVPLGSKAPDFDLPDTAGATVSRLDHEGQPLLVVFLCNHCPYVKHVADKLAKVTRDIMARGVAVVGINSNDAGAYPEDDLNHMAEEKRRRGYRFPYCFDESQEVAKAYGAQCTPDFFLYDEDHWLVYRGQFDAARPGNDVPVTGESLLAAVDALLEGGEMPEQVPSMGCNIKWKA